MSVEQVDGINWGGAVYFSSGTGRTQRVLLFLCTCDRPRRGNPGHPSGFDK